MATCWSIWFERNKRIFEDIIDNVDCLWDKIKFWVAICLFDVKDFKDVLFSDFLGVGFFVVTLFSSVVLLVI